jgi:hypothetical protein
VISADQSCAECDDFVDIGDDINMWMTGYVWGSCGNDVHRLDVGRWAWSLRVDAVCDFNMSKHKVDESVGAVGA